MSNWKVIRSETTDDGHTVELRYAEFGKGKAKLRSWKIFRDGEQAGYASTPEDVDVNFGRVMSGYVRNPETGNYERVQEGRDAQEDEAGRLAKREAAFKILTTLSAAQDGPEDRQIAWDRAETDACQRGTVGCCIDHDDDTECETW